jgi:iron complex transport system substrate-binding protein
MAALAAAALAGALITGLHSGAAPLVPGTQPRVASITPAGTDILVGIGAADHLVGISNFDPDLPQTLGKPRVGDYQSIDWERLAALRPQVLVVQYGEDRIPAGLDQRCAELGIRLVNLKIDTLDDVFTQTQMLAEVIDEPAKGRAAVARLRDQLQRVRARVAGLPAVSTAIVTGPSGLDLAGPGEFLDDLLQIAGGRNVAERTDRRYPTIDRELLVDMAPAVVIQLLPGGDQTPQVVAHARQFWDSMTDLPAVKNHRVAILTDWYCQQPGLHVGDLAEQFASILHHQAAGSSGGGTGP